MKQKIDKTVYTIKITGEQIMLIRSLVLRMDMMWIHISYPNLVGEDGDLEHAKVYECHFCHRGSYESAAAIPHKKDCIVPQVEREFGTLNEQFIEQEGSN